MVTLPYDGHLLSSNDMFILIRIEEKYNNDFDEMLNDNIITKSQWIEQTFYYCTVLLDWRNLKRYDVILKNDVSIYKEVLDFNTERYKIVDTYKIMTDKNGRYTGEYVNWRTNVFKRDDYTCQHCNKKGGILNAHHIKSYKDFKKLRYDLDNGITLCIDCHRLEHKKLRGAKK